MRKLSGLLLIGVLLLSGCTSAPEAAPPAAVETTSTFSDIGTLDDGLAHIRSLSADTPDLGKEIAGTAQALGDLVVEAELPWDVNNAIGQDLISLNLDALDNPSGGASLLSELNRIADEIDAAS